MKFIVVIAGLFLLVPSLVAAQAGGAICIFADPGGTDCHLTDTPGLIQYYVVHTIAAEALAVGFSAPMPACMVGATWLGDTQVYPVTIGNTQDGVVIGFSNCTSTPNHVLTINYFGAGTSLADCAYPVGPDPPQLTPEIVNCSQVLLEANGGISYINSALDCICEAVLMPPLLSVSPETINFGPSPQTIFVRNLGDELLTWSASETLDWISITPTSGTNNGEVEVTFIPELLPAPGDSGTIDFTSNGGNATVLVTTDLPVLGVDPTSLDFGLVTTLLPMQVSNVGTGTTLTWSATPDQPWIVATPSSGMNDVTVNVQIDRFQLSQGTNNGNILVSSNGGDINVTVTAQGGPLLSVSPSVLDFDYTSVLLQLQITNAGFDVLEWSLTTNQPWMSANPVTGTGDATINVAVNRDGLPDGTYFGAVSVTSNGGDKAVQVIMWVGTPIAVQETTWGRLKALYADD